MKVMQQQIPQFPKPVVWSVRIAIVILVGLWVAGGLYLNNQVKQDEKRIEQARLEAQRRDERLRRDARYRQDLQERTQAPQTRNAFDGR